jgi:hypothetical protein
MMSSSPLANWWACLLSLNDERLFFISCSWKCPPSVFVDIWCLWVCQFCYHLCNTVECRTSVQNFCVLFVFYVRGRQWPWSFLICSWWVQHRSKYLCWRIFNICLHFCWWPSSLCLHRRWWDLHLSTSVMASLISASADENCHWRLFVPTVCSRGCPQGPVMACCSFASRTENRWTNQITLSWPGAPFPGRYQRPVFYL